MNIFPLILLLFSHIYRVTFKYYNPQADSVFLSGTFNGWNPRSLKMSKTKNDTFVATLPLEEGVYQYKFVINGTRWEEDVHADSFVPDGFGGRNSVVLVTGDRFNETPVKKGDGIINTELYPEFNPQDVRMVYIKNGKLQVSLPVLSEDIDSVKAKVNNSEYVLKDEPFKFSNSVYGMDSVFMVITLYDGQNSIIYFAGYILLDQVIAFESPRFLDTTVFYQIFPERFYNGNRKNDPAGAQKWKYEKIGTPWGWSVFYGGDLDGVLQRLSYLKELGINAIYFNPIFTSFSNHKYDIVDYFHVDKHFGGDSTFFILLRTLHKNGVKVILDGVFNHTSDRHPFFEDVREKGVNSKYFNYYIIKKWPFPRHFSPTEKPIDYYECWWGFGSLPKLNYQNPEVVKYILNVAKYWEQKGIDGFRLDVPNEVPHFFWQIFRDTMKYYNKDFYIVGEIWGNPTDWLNGKEFDGTMNYPLRSMIIDLINGNLKGKEFVKRVKRFYLNMPEEAQKSMLNILSTHDTRRIRTVFDGNMEKVKLAYLLSFTMPGVPTVYYGDEIGMSGGKDPDSRRVFPWDSVNSRKPILEYFKKLITFRKAHPSFNGGEIVYCGENPLCIERKNKRKAYKIYINPSDSTLKFRPHGKVVFSTSKKQDRLKAYGGVIVEE